MKTTIIIQKINRPIAVFQKKNKINKIDNPVARLRKKKNLSKPN